MSTVDVLAASWVVLFCGGGWMIHALLMMWTTRAVPMMARLDAPAPEVWEEQRALVGTLETMAASKTAVTVAYSPPAR